MADLLSIVFHMHRHTMLWFCQGGKDFKDMPFYQELYGVTSLWTEGGRHHCRSAARPGCGYDGTQWPHRLGAATHRHLWPRLEDRRW